MRWITKKVSRRNENQDASPALIAVTGVDIFIDGIVTGAGFAAGGNTGILLAIALSLEFLFLGLAVASGIKTSRFLSIGIPSGLFLLVVAGGILGKTVLDGVRPDILATVLAFGAVALMYLVTEELLVEAHRYAETPFATSMFFIGFLLYLIIEELL
jgi:ZIP family zinc transporter